MLQSDLDLHRKGMAFIMHLVFQIMILESNTTFKVVVGCEEWEEWGVKHQEKPRLCVTLLKHCQQNIFSEPEMPLLEFIPFRVRGIDSQGVTYKYIIL